MSLISSDVSLFPSRLLRTCPSKRRNLGTSGPVPYKKKQRLQLSSQQLKYVRLQRVEHCVSTAVYQS